MNPSLNKIVSLIDLTSLNDTDTGATITTLCKKALSVTPHVAAVCVLPSWVSLAKNILKNSDIKVATVINFPAGKDSLDKIVTDTTSAINDGADEIDLVTPYHCYFTHDHDTPKAIISHCKMLCHEKITLKVILETGALIAEDKIKTATQDAIDCGANFIKTSTGKTPIGATIEAAKYILEKINKNPDKKIGIKISGGIKSITQAQAYLTLANEMMGANWARPSTFRFGASSLLDELIAQ